MGGDRDRGRRPSLTLAEALHLDPQLFLDAIAGGQSHTSYAHLEGATVLSGELPAQFALDGVVEDLGLIRTAIDGSGVDPTLVGALLDTFRRASGAGHHGEDIAAVVTAFRPTTG